MVALPGPPREMWPMWREVVAPRLRSRGLGSGEVATTLRTTGIGESLVADRIRAWLEGGDPSVATYARGEAVDVRISGGRESVERAERAIRDELEGHVWATGATTWGAAIAEALDRHHMRIAMLEVGTRGALVALLGEDLGARLLAAHVGDALHSGAEGQQGRRSLEQATRSVADAVGAEVALGVRARPHRGDILASIVVVTPAGSLRERRLVFLSDVQGRHRAAIAAAATLFRVLEDETGPG